MAGCHRQRTTWRINNLYLIVERLPMSTPCPALKITDALFFNNPHINLQLDEALACTRSALHGMDDGELFLEYRENESLSLEDGLIRTAHFSTSTGFGLRAVLGEEIGFAHTNEMSHRALLRAADTVESVRSGRSGVMTASPHTARTRLYSDANPLTQCPFTDRAAIMSEIDAYARSRDPRVVQVMASILGEWQAIQIIRADGTRFADLRPLVRLNVSVVVEHKGRRESGSHGLGGRYDIHRLLATECWQGAIDEALRQALVAISAQEAPAGEMEVVLGPGWPGILLHEAVGHGLEGDFNRKGTSVFTGRIGTQVAASGVTVVDDGTLPDRRGSLTIDDEGTPTQRTVLIENGILQGYMQDRLNARLMGTSSTGNGRRQSYAHVPIPRMTNTFMLSGKTSTEEMIHSVKRGLYAVHFGGGQVDITSGRFVFAASEAYLIENGRITTPVKGATLIGNGAQALQCISMIGETMQLDHGVGTCGKAGQNVPVGVGQPSLKMTGLTVGGTTEH